MTQQTRIVVIVGSVVAALLLVAIVVGIVVITTLNAQASEADYRACMAAMGVGPGGTVTDVQGMADAAEYCIDR